MIFSQLMEGGVSTYSGVVYERVDRSQLLFYSMNVQCTFIWISYITLLGQYAKLAAASFGRRIISSI